MKEVIISEKKRKTIVNAWNEWDPLKHVIVGRADGTMVQAPELALQREWPEYGFTSGKYGPYPEEMTASSGAWTIVPSARPTITCLSGSHSFQALTIVFLFSSDIIASFMSFG